MRRHRSERAHSLCKAGRWHAHLPERQWQRHPEGPPPRPAPGVLCSLLCPQDNGGFARLTVPVRSEVLIPPPTSMGVTWVVGQAPGSETTLTL